MEVPPRLGRGYDAYGRMNSDTLKAGQTVVSSMTYGYDADNNITAKKTTGVAGAADNTYTYDQLGRLTAWTAGTKTTEYGWDATSNRTKAGTKLAQYDERNRRINDGTSDYTYSPRGTLLTKQAGTTTEALTFDAFDRMIKNSDRDFTYDALDRPVAAGTARMRYAGFSDEVVTDGTQSFGRSASDGLLSLGYETTKRLVLADRHGDVIGGFDPTDTTLTAGLPDSRTFDPFGNSTAANGLKYRVGYQGDWTDPRSGDVNQGARWYNPESGTFNSRDTMTYAGGVASSLPNLYAYAAGNPITLSDPTGNYPVDEVGEPNTECKKVLNGDGYIWKCSEDDVKGPNDPPPPPTDCKTNNDCPTPPPPPGGCKAKKSCPTPPPPPNECKTKNCKADPPPPPKCDAECQRKKKEEEDRRKTEEALRRQEDRAQTIPVTPPGAPSCSGGNPELCSSQPDRPADQNGGYVDRTTETGGSAEVTYQNAVSTLGSAIGDVTQTGSLGTLMTGSMMLPDICRCGGLAGLRGLGGVGVGFGPGGVNVGGATSGGAVAVAGVIVVAGTGVLLMDELNQQSDNPYVQKLAGPGAAQPPDDDDEGYGGGHEPVEHTKLPTREEAADLIKDASAARLKLFDGVGG